MSKHDLTREGMDQRRRTRSVVVGCSKVDTDGYQCTHTLSPIESVVARRSRVQAECSTCTFNRIVYRKCHTCPSFCLFSPGRTVSLLVSNYEKEKSK